MEFQDEARKKTEINAVTRLTQSSSLINEAANYKYFLNRNKLINIIFPGQMEANDDKSITMIYSSFLSLFAEKRKLTNEWMRKKSSAGCESGWKKKKE